MTQHRFKQLRDLASAMRLHLHFRAIEHGTTANLAAYQEERLRDVVRHAVKHSKAYARLCDGIDLSGDFALQDLPVTDKRMMMDDFDDWVTDPRLQLTEIERQIVKDPDEQYYLGEYRIVATSGSSGLRGIFVYDRHEWQVVIAAALRWAEMFGVSPIGLSTKKLASVKAGSATHATSRLGQSMALGMPNLLMLDATKPLDELVDELNAFQPKLFMGYASLIGLLAIEQIEGRLKIKPEMVASFSEMLGPDRVARAQEAWGITPFNHYGAAEQVMIAADCDKHMGLHHFADMSLVEIVDEEGRPVPRGTPGHKILLTNLHRYVQPVIRYEITDLVTEKPGLCDCGRPFPLFSEIGGRTEDIISLPAADGSRISISPMLIFDCMIGDADVAEYQYHVDGDCLNVRIVAREGAQKERIAATLQSSLDKALRTQGASGFQIDISFRDRFIRTEATMGKLKLTGAPS
ncbi:phenylacetate--CoA ligase family protein [Marimonas lutisalis]|uniref:phenylacetate--CoA ligase family protein n=1 Tax=Marimonas lutisalis TaxID=2545756 RepID=UPI0010F575D8|nr:phenylacetate--CoA ligase family protein [Marimonas lutisalis]